MPSTSPAVSAPTSRATTTRCSVMNGGLPAALSSAATAASRPSAPAGPRRPRRSSPAAARPGMVMSSSARVRIVGAEELGDEIGDDPVAQRRIGALDQIGRRSRVRTSSSTIRHTATEPATSCTRTMRQPCDDAVRDRGQRRGAAGVDARGRAGRRGSACSTTTAAACTRARRVRRSRAGAPRSAPASCRGRGRRRARSGPARARRPRPARARSSRNAVTSPSRSS